MSFHAKIMTPISIFQYLMISAVQNALISASRVGFALIALDLGASPLMVGVIIGMLGVGPVLVTSYIGRWIDENGLLTAIIAGIILPICAMGMAFFFYNVAALIVAAPCIGIASSIIHVCVVRVLGSEAVASKRVRNLGYIAAINSFAQFVAPAAVGLVLDNHGGAMVLLICAIVPLVSFAMMAANRTRDYNNIETVPTSDKGNSLQLLREVRLRSALIINASFAVTLTTYPFIISMYATSISLSATQTGLIVASGALGSVVVRLLSGVVIARFTPSHICCAGLLVCAVIFCCIPSVTAASALIAISFIFGIFVGIGMPVVLSEIYTAAPAGRISEAIGLSLSTAMLAQAALPMAFGMSATYLSFAAASYGYASILLGLSAYALGHGARAREGDKPR